MKIKLAYFNLAFIAGYFGIEYSLHSLNATLAVGLIFTLWYNWETLNRLKGLPSKLNRVNILIGLAVLSFAALMAAEGFYRIIIIDQTSTMTEGSIFLALAQIIVGFSNLLITAKTISLYWKPKPK